ncbi:MAG: M23 family metallopeptidase, partial [Brevinematales bacterium]
MPLISVARVTIMTNQRGYEWTYIARNEFACPIQVLLRYTNENKNEEMVHHVIPPYSEQIVLIISNRNTPSLRFAYELGNPFSEPEDVEYWLPLAPGQVVRVTQGYKTRFSHKGKNAYSIDFALSIGTPVYAARDGVVVLVKDNSR